MGNANKGAGATSNYLPYVAVAAVAIVIALLLLLPQQASSANQPPPGQAALPPVSKFMKEEGCKAVYGKVMEGQCTGGLYPLGEVESSTGTKKLCCGTSVNLENEAKEPLPITPPAGYVPPSNATPAVAT